MKIWCLIDNLKKIDKNVGSFLNQYFLFFYIFISLSIKKSLKFKDSIDCDFSHSSSVYYHIVLFFLLPPGLRVNVEHVFIF